MSAAARTTDVRQAAPLDDAGYELIPLQKRGKRPVQRDWTKRRADNTATLRRMERGNGNTGVRLRSADLVLDWDPRNDSGRWEVGDHDEFMLWHGLDPTDWPTVRTGSGGRHYYLTKPEDVPVLDGPKDFPAMEFKSIGRQVVAPGSVHPNGNRYDWIGDPVDEFGAPDAPDALMDAARRPVRRGPSSAEAGVHDGDELAAMLAELDPEDYRDHEGWLEIMMACHHATGGAGREEFVAWSTSDPLYGDHAEEVAGRWDSLDTSRSDGVTYRTLHKALSDAGSADAIPRPDPADDFDDIEDGPDATDAPSADRSRREVKKSGNPLDLVVEEMNGTYCAVLDGGQFHVFMEDFDDAFDREVWTRLSREAFRNYLQDEKVPVPDTPKHRYPSRADHWLDHKRRRKYRGIVMDPQGLDRNADKLNLWRGWAVDPAPGDWSLMQELIGEVLCDGDSEGEAYVRRWIAYMLQRPWETPEAAIAFRGTEGTGKGTLGRALMRIAGSHGLTVSSRAQFAGRFNSHLRNCVFLFADEAVWPGDKEGEGIIKQLVTEPVISYEAKGKDITPGRNMVHLMLASNEEWIVPAGRDARRFFVSDVSDRRRNDQEFFGRLNRQMADGGLAAMMHDLMGMDLGDWRPSVGIPQTRALGDQKLQSLDPASKFWLSVLSEGTLADIVSAEGDFEDWQDGPIEVGPAQKDELVAAYDAFLTRKRILSARATHKALVNAARPFGLEVARPSGGGKRVWVVPPLSEMRSRFERAMGTEGVFDEA